MENYYYPPKNYEGSYSLLARRLVLLYMGSLKLIAFLFHVKRRRNHEQNKGCCQTL